MKRCPICKQKFEPRFNTMQKVCGHECAAAYAAKSRIKQQRQGIKDFKQKHLIETIGYQHKLTQPVFNKMRVLEEKAWFRERGIEPYCISCGKTKMDFCCGHFKTVGSQGNLRYDRRNTLLQCNFRCNNNLSGNIEGNKSTHGYKKGLILRFGQEAGQAIIDHCEINTSPVKWHWEDLKNFRKECNSRIRELNISRTQELNI